MVEDYKVYNRLWREWKQTFAADSILYRINYKDSTTGGHPWREGGKCPYPHMVQSLLSLQSFSFPLPFKSPNLSDLYPTGFSGGGLYNWLPM